MPLKAARSPIIACLILATFPVSAAADHLQTIENTVITATREARDRFSLAESVSSFDRLDIEDIAPSHPADILNRSPGVYISNLGGEGHMTAIRQPISTAGVYLYLEDGIPTRPTGFFNHNALYEVNIPQGGRLEVTKGPGSALYGSDAIGGVINVITSAPPSAAAHNLNFEAGSYGWRRLLLDTGDTADHHAYRVSLNLTDNQGYRHASSYNRQSLNTRWDIDHSDTLHIKTLLAYTRVEQSGSSALSEDDYKSNPRRNYFHGDTGFRDVDAVRLSSEINIHQGEHGLFTLTPFYRYNRMDMMPSWMITYDPNTRETRFETLGLLAKYRRQLPGVDGEIILGADIDHSPSRYLEREITMIQSGDIYTGHQKTGRIHYDFEATQQSLSPYLHTDFLLLPQLRLSAGIRYDYFSVDYSDRLDASVPETTGSGTWIRPESQELSYDQWSPKLGLIYSYHAQHNSYVSYRQAFRAPTVGALFRAGSSNNSDQLKPVESESYEIGWRGILNNNIGYDLAVYQMLTKNDIVTFISNNNRENANAGKTRHQGIELGLFGDINHEWSWQSALSYSRQHYREFAYIFQCFSPACGRIPGDPPIIENRDFAGNQIGKAPQTLGNLTLAWQPAAVDGLRAELEVEHVGSYYTDETNTQRYGGHELLNLRARYRTQAGFEVYSRINNLTDKRYSTYTSNQVTNSDIDYRPGMPLSMFIGFRWNIQ